MLASQLLSLARRYADDETEPYYITDEEMYLFLSDAERDLAREGELLRALIPITVVKDDEWVTLPTSPEIIDIHRAELKDTATGYVYGLRVVGAHSNSPTELGSYMSEGHRVVPGRPTELAIGIVTGQVKFDKTADKAYTLNIHATVYPSKVMELEFDEPSIPSRFHRYIPYGAAVRAIEAAEAEHFSPERVASMTRAWGAGLNQARLENRRMQRDHGEVKPTNDLWTM